MNKLSIILLILVLFISACATLPQKTIVEEKIVYKKCQIPEIPKTELEEFKKEDSYSERLKKLIHNYAKLLEENTLLRQIIELCR